MSTEVTVTVYLQAAASVPDEDLPTIHEVNLVGSYRWGSSRFIPGQKVPKDKPLLGIVSGPCYGAVYAFLSVVCGSTSCGNPYTLSVGFDDACHGEGHAANDPKCQYKFEVQNPGVNAIQFEYTS